MLAELKLYTWLMHGLRTATCNERQVFDKHGVPPIIDFLSLDTEGAELRVLHGIDHAKHCFRALAVESNLVEPRRSMMRSFLEGKAYKYVGSEKWDDYYTKECH